MKLRPSLSNINLILIPVYWISKRYFSYVSDVSLHRKYKNGTIGIIINNYSQILSVIGK